MLFIVFRPWTHNTVTHDTVRYVTFLYFKNTSFMTWDEIFGDNLFFSKTAAPPTLPVSLPETITDCSN